MTILAESLDTRQGPKYVAIADAIADAIRTGRLAAGTRLPTHRELARDLGVTVGTVTRAYAIATKRGHITGEVGRGSFVRHLPPAEFDSPSRAGAPGAMIDLRQNFPVSVGTIEHDCLKHTMDEIARRTDLAALMNSDWQTGHSRHGRAGASWISRSGYECDPGRVFTCSGVQPALCAITAAVCEPGDVILTPELAYPGIRALAHHFAITIHGIAMDEHGIAPDSFDQLCTLHRPEYVYLATTLHSPTAITMPDARRREIAMIALKHDVLIVEEDDSSYFFQQQDRPTPLSALAPERSIFVADTTRAISLGLRTTFVSVPERISSHLPAAITATMWMPSPLLSQLTAALIDNGSADRLISARRHELAARHRIVVETLGRAKYRTDPAAHHVWLELPTNWGLRAESFVAAAARAGVGVTGAEWFVMPGIKAPEAVRICIGAASNHDELRRALSGIRMLLDQKGRLQSNGPII